MADALDPGRIAQQRRDLIAHLVTYRRFLAEELRRTDAALRDLGATPALPAGKRRARTGGTYDTLRRYIAHMREKDEDITPQAAWAWMSDQGWQTASLDPISAVASALSQLARWGELERVRHGRYREYVRGGGQSMR